LIYRVKEVFVTLQGEGAQAGRVAVFCRFSKCNLWTGREADRHRAVCQFCDTDFVGTDGQNGGEFETADALARHVAAFWRALSPTLKNPSWSVPVESRFCSLMNPWLRLFMPRDSPWRLRPTARSRRPRELTGFA